jgi:hypothetical protein
MLREKNEITGKEGTAMRTPPITIPLYDIYPAAYLEFHNIHLNLTKQGTRVVFEAPANDGTYRLLREYQDNNPIPLLDYVAVLRRLRARMLEARDENGKRERETGHGYNK